MSELYLRDAALAMAVTTPAFPYYLDGPHGECFGAEPAEYDGAPAVRLVALALPVCIERGDGYAPVCADLAGAEGFVSVETVRMCYIDAAWTLRRGAWPAAPATAPLRDVFAALARLAEMATNARQFADEAREGARLAADLAAGTGGRSSFD